MSSHSRKPRNFHDLEKQFVGNNYQKLSHVRDIVTSLMDDLYEQQILDTDTFSPNDFEEVSPDEN